VCFGAAARDAERPCVDKRRSIVPTFADVDKHRFSPCKYIKGATDPQVCTFGVSPARAKHRIALVGDSHALHWRPALDGVARAKHWRGYSLTIPVCEFSTAAEKYGPVGFRTTCGEWVRSVTAWLRHHPDVSTVFVSQAAFVPLGAAPGSSMLDTEIAGYREAWRALPKSVKQVIVIRDVPLTSDGTIDCVKRVVAEGKVPPGPACPIRRSFAVRRDAALAAVLRIHHRRYRYVNLLPFFCDANSCYLVVGGVLVNRDLHHMTRLYAQTLAPYLQRALRRLRVASW
jgi:SGNH domain (fused to AT3 domains)